MTLIRITQKAFLGMLLALLIISPSFAFAQNNGRSGRDQDKNEKTRDWNNRWSGDIDSRWCHYLPPGIAKRFPSCGTPNNPSDTTSPVISNIRIDSISQTSARVRFDANESVRAQVFLHTQSGFSVDGSGVLKSYERGWDDSHDIMVRSLVPGTTYYALVRVVDRSGNVALSGQQTFSTLPGSRDTTPPEVTNIVIQGVTDATATISWSTNEPATTVAWYRSEPLVARLFSDRNGKETGSDSKSLTTNHSITLTGLNPGTTYLVMVGGKDASGNMGSSSEQKFTTQKINDTTAPIIYNISVRTHTDNKTATITWYTNEAADSQIFYGTTASVHGQNSLAIKDPAFTQNHELTVINLSVGVPYYFEVQSSDRQGNKQTSPLYVLQL